MEAQQIVGFELGFTEEGVRPSASRLISVRKITPAVVEDTAPSALSSGFPSSLVRKWITDRRSFRSSSGNPFWSAQWKIKPSVDS